MNQRVFPSLLDLCHQTVQAAVQRFAFSGHFFLASDPLFARDTTGEAGIESEPVFFVDATCGNGHDTLMLARLRNSLPLKLRNSISLVAFDIQEVAIAATKDKLAHAQLLSRVSFIHKSHADLQQHIPPQKCIAVAMYNLGYLPGREKGVVTQPVSTLASLAALPELFLSGGLLSVHTYAGHSGGAEESEAVDAWFCSLESKEWAVARYAVCNKKRNQEALYLAERRV